MRRMGRWEGGDGDGGRVDVERGAVRGGGDHRRGDHSGASWTEMAGWERITRRMLCVREEVIMVVTVCQGR